MQKVTYAIRNSLIMIGVWVAIVGAGWSRFYLVEDAEIASLKSDISQKKERLSENQKVVNNYDKLVARYRRLKAKVEDNAKLLVKAKSADQVYSSLISLGQNDAFTYMNFVAIDSTHYDRFGLLKFDVSGEGRYKNFTQFVNRLEYSRALFKIREMSIEPLTGVEQLGQVRYSFKLESLYDQNSIFDDYSAEPREKLPAYTYNSFYPLIHEVRENEDNLPDIEKSKLIGVGDKFVSLRDQNDKIQYLYVGDRVYLGKLISVNIRKNSATFEINEGGIVKHITRVLK